ncbi:hypothetical protein [Streptomyces rugosispiralis]|uniref:Uncharacterized protein n=1 Tax=Streptomyces rugosispiralis TaxID=2967341 RepID=A0ABT1VA01_9ACTN|nr:hypothetical protein [Streptomyces rugosispiralis]MCQ8193590.1 hypothetical protein [Streptomyces rugosispiralis]
MGAGPAHGPHHPPVRRLIHPAAPTPVDGAAGNAAPYDEFVFGLERILDGVEALISGRS